MKNIAQPMGFAILAILVLPTLLATKALATDIINLVVAPSWGAPEFNQYTALNETSEWRYSRENATLIIAKAYCPLCKAITQQDIALYNQAETSAIMLHHQAGPAMLRLVDSPKGQLLRIFQINSAGVNYQFQLGMNTTLHLTESFALEQEFFDMINSFEPN